MKSAALATRVAPSLSPRHPRVAPGAAALAAPLAPIRWRSSLAEALGESGRSARTVMVAFGDGECSYSGRMERQTYTDRAVIARSRHFHCVKLDTRFAYGDSIARQYAVRATPSVLFVEHTGVVLRRRDGFQTAAALAALMGEVAPEEIQWGDSLATALQQAERIARPIMLAFDADWWPYARRMAWETYGDPQVIALSRRFHCVKVDSGSAYGKELRQAFGINVFPCVLFLGPDGATRQTCEGFRAAADLAALMRNATGG